jgi:hypothetical protein
MRPAIAASYFYAPHLDTGERTETSVGNYSDQRPTTLRLLMDASGRSFFIFSVSGEGRIGSALTV